MNDQANGVVERLDVKPASVTAWNRNDTTWMLGLFGTAIGAGTLFLPINAGIGGFWPLMVLAVLAFPMTFYAHRGLTRFVLSDVKAPTSLKWSNSISARLPVR